MIQFLIKGFLFLTLVMILSSAWFFIASVVVQLSLFLQIFFSCLAFCYCCRCFVLGVILIQCCRFLFSHFVSISIYFIFVVYLFIFSCFYQFPYQFSFVQYSFCVQILSFAVNLVFYHVLIFSYIFTYFNSIFGFILNFVIFLNFPSRFPCTNTLFLTFASCALFLIMFFVQCLPMHLLFFFDPPLKVVYVQHSLFSHFFCSQLSLSWVTQRTVKPSQILFYLTTCIQRFQCSPGALLRLTTSSQT